MVDGSRISCNIKVLVKPGLPPMSTSQSAMPVGHAKFFRPHSKVDIGLIAKTAVTISLLISVCYQDKKYTCKAAYQTCIYYGQKLHDPSDVTGCCWWYNTQCIVPPAPIGGGGGGDGQFGPRSPNGINGGHKKQ